MKVSLIPRTVWVLGYVSLLMDLSSEWVHSLLPIFLVTTLSATPLMLGLLEGVADATALIVQVFAGALSDVWGKRKNFLLLGYGLAAVSKPLFPQASSIGTVFIARCLDRIGKGIRGAPRDALITEVTPAEYRGASFGLRQSMDTVGAIFGPVLAIIFMMLSHNISAALWFAVVPAIGAVLLITVGIKEPMEKGAIKPFYAPIRFALLGDFSRYYWWVVIIGAVFSLARFSEAFLILRAQELGFSAQWAPLVMVMMSLFYAASAYPAGKLSDEMNRATLLSVGLLLLIVADLVLAFAHSSVALLVGAAFWGLHMGFSQGILAAMVSDAIPTNLKGTAFGIFNLVSGMSLLVASLLAGWLWQFHGSFFTFMMGLISASLALALLCYKEKIMPTPVLSSE